jgi:ATP-dependent Zn protease
MKSVFDEARSKAPCLLFIDEIDSFGSRAINDSQHADYKRQVINGLLEQLDGYERLDGVVVVGATNHPENLDPAITRPGRLDRHFVIPLPDEATRREIFMHHSGFSVPDGYEKRFARSTVGMTGADIKRTVRDAKRLARRRGDELAIEHVLKAARPLAEVPANNMRLAAVHETGHAIVGTKLGLPLEAITISDIVVADGPDMFGGAIFNTPPFALRTRGVYLKQLSMMLAGIAAETFVFGEFTDGGAISDRSDLARATMLATQFEACLGFGETFLVEVVDEQELSRLRSINPALRLAVQKRLSEAFSQATTLLQESSEALRVISSMLQRQHFLSASVVEDILRGSFKYADDPLGYDTTDTTYPLQAAGDALGGVHKDQMDKKIDNALRGLGVRQ